MSAGTGISWATDTWNALSGCTKVSRGCKFCYAARLAATRLKHQAKYKDLAVYDKGVPRWNREVRFDPEALLLPFKWRATEEPRRIFVNSMSDLFHEDVLDEVILDHWTVMANTPQHRYLILTKRPERMAQFTRALGFRTGKTGIGRLDRPDVSKVAVYSSRPEYLPNVALGVSVENVEAKDRVLSLRRCPAAWRFVSVEPLVEDIGDVSAWFGGIDRVHQVIIGGETGPKGLIASMDLKWVQDIEIQTKRAGAHMFYKQPGAAPTYGGQPITKAEAEAMIVSGSGGFPAAFYS